jgi:erythronate-4-phosphate dehydrogenase
MGDGLAEEFMKVVADESIEYAREAFSQFGSVRLMPGRAIDRAAVRDADLLFVRSRTKINAALLEGSRVRFVGSGVIGLDHVDLEYLKQHGIAFAYAPGCNANSVSEYIVAVLLELAHRGGWKVAGKTLGVIGVGNVGTRMVEKAKALGMNVLENDPPLARATGDPRFLPLKALFQADIITLHVPLTEEGQDATYHLANKEFMSHMKPGGILINSSRGSVVDGDVLLEDIRSGRLSAAVLDVWEGEPNLNPQHVEAVAIATPHIAGYSFDGKVNGTVMIYQAACKFLGVKPTWDPKPLMPSPPCPRIELDARGMDDDDSLRHVVQEVYDVVADDAALRKIVSLPIAERGPYFDRLRKDYPVRREFFNTEVRMSGGIDALREKVKGLGFKTG